MDDNSLLALLDQVLHCPEFLPKVNAFTLYFLRTLIFKDPIIFPGMCCLHLNTKYTASFQNKVLRAAVLRITLCLTIHAKYTATRMRPGPQRAKRCPTY